MGKLIIGLVLVAAAFVAFQAYHPEAVQDAKRTAEVAAQAVQRHSGTVSHAVGQAAGTVASEAHAVSYDVCRQRYLDETFCYRKAAKSEDPAKGKAMCDAEVQARCGTNGAAKGG